MINTEPKETLCVFCARACNKGCNWSANLEPVDGWTVEENTQGVRVIACPWFVKETEETRKNMRIDTQGMMHLMEAMAKQMREDYIHGIGPYDHRENRKKVHPMTRAEVRNENRKIIERWLVKGRGAKMLNLTEESTKTVIRQLRVMARRYEEDLARVGL